MRPGKSLRNNSAHGAQRNARDPVQARPGLPIKHRAPQQQRQQPQQIPPARARRVRPPGQRQARRSRRRRPGRRDRAPIQPEQKSGYIQNKINQTHPPPFVEMM